MANKIKNQPKAPANNNEEIAKELTATEYDQELGSEFPYKPSDQGMNKNKKQQNPQSQ